MRTQLSSFTAAVALSFLALSSSSHVAHAQWTVVGDAAPGYLDTCVLLTDGRVMCHEATTNAWHLLTPDSSGSYINGNWSSTATMPDGTDTSTLNGGCAPCVYAPLYFLSSVLADGRVVVVGGEYNTNGQTWSDIGFMYDPVTDTWSSQLSMPWGAGTIGDAQGIVLANGTLLLARSIGSTAIASFNPATLTFTAFSPTGKADSNNEENWNILPDGTVLTVDARIQSQSEIYDPVTNNWTSQSMPVNIADTGTNTNSREIGPAVLRPDGTMIAFSSNWQGQNALYDTNTGTWSNTAAMDFPTVAGQTYALSVADGPASLLPNGNVLVMASPVTNLNCNSNPPTCGVFNRPSSFFEFDYATNTLAAVANSPNAASFTSYQGRMLLLPTGKVLLTAYDQGATQDVVIYSNGGVPQEAWRPVITSCLGVVEAGQTYSIEGTLFNGFSEGATYGDDAAMSTNYPLVRIKNISSGNVFYARTHDHSRMGVQAVGSNEIITTMFDTPAGLEAGESELVVVANGIASNPIIINRANTGPFCDAGTSYSVECVGATTSIQMDGSGSSDSDAGDQLDFDWTTDCPGGVFDDATAESPVLTVSSGSPSCPLDCAVSLTVTDCYGETSDCDADINVFDDTNPTITSGAVGGLVDDGCAYSLPFSATISDGCCLDIGDVSVAVSLLTDNATLGTPVISIQSFDLGKRIEVTGRVLVSNLTSCPATVQITFDALDCCGNAAIQSVVTADVNDTIAPVITCPDPITLDRGDKLCNTLVQDWLNSTTATDNCATTGQEFASGYVGLDIPDDNFIGVSHTINVPVSVPIELVQLELRALHKYVGDLMVDIEHLGTTVRVINQPGDPADIPDPPFFGCGADNYNIVLADSGAPPIEDLCAVDMTTPPIYSPNNPLSAFDGLDAAGDWTITLIDVALGQVGTLEAWSVHINGGLTITDDAPECGFPYDSTTVVTWDATDACGNTTDCTSTITIKPAHRIDTTEKGSLLMYSNVELKWDASGNLVQDSVLEITNDFDEDVYVQFYFVNGDDARDAVFAGDPPQMVSEGEPGCNNVDCQALLTANQPMYFSMSSGSPLGCQPFTVLDPGGLPGRPDPESATGGRVLRGFVYAWAVDSAGEEIRWNHLSGSGTIVNYDDATAWEYNAYSAATTCLAQGEHPLDCTKRDENGTCCLAEPIPGRLDLDAFQYDIAFGRLLMSFVSSGSNALSGGGASTQVDTDLTLYPISQDFRSEGTGPVTTLAKFDIWNMNERRFSGTQRCVTCWDQTLLSRFAAPDHFLMQNLQSDKGKARIDGVFGDGACGGYGESAAILGVTNKLLSFSGASIGAAASGATLTGQGMESATIRNDIIRPPGELIGVVGEPEVQPIDLSLRSSVSKSKAATVRDSGRK